MLLIIFSILFALIGTDLLKDPPKMPDKSFGFRTKKAMKNLENWQLSQHLLGRYLKRGVIPGLIFGTVLGSLELSALIGSQRLGLFTNCLIGEGILLVFALCLIVYLVDRQLT